MDKRYEVVAVIPARRNSTGLPLKNIRPLCGKPLIAYSIESALQAGNIDRVVVSTEDREIADTAIAHGAEVPFLRPQWLAGHKSLFTGAIGYTLDRLYPARPENLIVVSLLPTSPFRSPSLVRSLTQLMMDGATEVHTVKKIPTSRDSHFLVDGGHARSVFSHCPSGQEASYYRPYGLYSAWFAYADPYKPRRPYIHIISDEVQFIDIDRPFDFRLAEEVIRAGMFDFKGSGA